MRDLLAVFGVVVLAVCAGVTSAYLNVDLTPPGLDLIRPPKPADVAQLKLEERQSTIQADAKECKYCVETAALAQRFARHAKSERLKATTLRDSFRLAKFELSKEDELLKAEQSADKAEAAAAALTSWASRCKSDDICRVPTRVAAAKCDSSASSSVSAAFSLAAAVKRSASGCAAASCPSIDCKASATLRADTQSVERALALAGGRVDQQASGKVASQLPVGASTLSAEIDRMNDEAIYISKKLTLISEASGGGSSGTQFARLASEMVEERAVSAVRIANVMEHAAEISGNPKYDLRNEAAWRMKSLAANLAELGKATELNGGVTVDWLSAANSLGAAFIDIARMRAMLDRKASNLVTGCNADAPTAAQQLREAMAMLDLCRMRSACTGRTNANASNGLSSIQIARRAESVAERLIVQEIGSPDLLQISESGQEENAIHLLRSQQGVCTKAAEFRQASSAASEMAKTVAQSVIPVGQPSTAAISPQDLVSGAVNSAFGASPSLSGEGEAEVVNASGLAHGPAGDTDVIPAAAPAAGSSPAFSGNLLTPSAPAFVGSDGLPVESAKAVPDGR